MYVHTYVIKNLICVNIHNRIYLWGHGIDFSALYGVAKKLIGGCKGASSQEQSCGQFIVEDEVETINSNCVPTKVGLAWR
jgi:hypothetical protein